ncbi:sugar ABC transporter permease [uncultured Cohaesibacter sp.]|uniref:carbohydrate ABC transporter permease n=1 Tax=uncultured Cohaesibacter sp. TaxID=1002546 RepID=UPI00292D717F|nr:sugar ABC transporter permease [uncultured Cohaesibacter sp.]
MARPVLRLRPNSEGYLLLAPAVAVYLLFAFYPMIDVFSLSFSQWNGLVDEKVWVGWENYRYVMTKDTVFWRAVTNTVLWTLFAVTVPNILAFGLALALNQNLPTRSLLRIAIYLPVIIAPIAVATIWRWMYDPFFGLFNVMLTSAGLAGWIKDWLGNKDVALWSIFIAYVWQTVGFAMVLFLAGLQNVSKTLIEAARIDGAGRYKTFRHVTFPALRSTITIVLVLSTINSLKAFDIVYGMTGGGPAQSTQMLAMWAYTQAMQLGSFGRGSAISVILLLLTLIIVIPYLIWQMRKTED